MSWPMRKRTKAPARSVRAVVRKALNREQRRRGQWYTVFNQVCEGILLAGCENQGGDPCCPESQYRIVLVSNATLQGPAAGGLGPYGDNLLVEHIRCRLMFNMIPDSTLSGFAGQIVDHGQFFAGVKKGQVDVTGLDPQFYNGLKPFDRTEAVWLKKVEHEWHPNVEQCETVIATSTTNAARSGTYDYRFANVTGTSPGATTTAINNIAGIPWAEAAGAPDATTGSTTGICVTTPGRSFNVKFDLRRKIALKGDQTLNMELAWARTTFPASAAAAQPAMLVRGYIDMFTTSV